MGTNELRRISIRDSKFHTISGGEEATIDSGYIEVVIVNAALVSRAYYTNAYDPNRVAVPTCWSSDTQLPSEDVPQEQRFISYRSPPRLYSVVLIAGVWACKTTLGYSLDMIHL